MTWIDWLIVIIPMLGILGMAIYSKKYVTGVVDYLAAGRVAGRYVLTIGEMSAGLGILSLVALSEAYYRCGGAASFWAAFAGPIGLLFVMTGFCIYRFRETKALSNGQFLEMRYSRNFRIIASACRIMAEMLVNSIGPAVAVNFFIYYIGFPHEIVLFGLTIPTFTLLVGVVLVLALILILPAGRISLLVSDCIQGLICYPVFLAITAFVMIKFSYMDEIFPAMANRVEGESFYNPFDIEKLQDFNLVSIIIIIIVTNYARAAWYGNDTTTSAKTPHEQKMAGVLSVWRKGLGGLMCALIALCIYTTMNHPNYSKVAHNVRQELSIKVADELVDDVELRAELEKNIRSIPVITRVRGEDAPLSQDENIDTVYMDKASDTFGDTPQGNLLLIKFKALYNQMMMPIGLRALFPAGLIGVFCLLAILLMVTTDDSRMFNASTAIVQDLVIPFQRSPMTPETHTRLVKWLTVFVAAFFFCGSMLFEQMDYIQMFVSVMCAIWMGGAAPIMVFGLYSKFGNTIGAYCALLFGSGTAIGGILARRNWADLVYPFLTAHETLYNIVNSILNAVTGVCSPYIEWTLNAKDCPITGIEFTGLATLFGTLAYVIGSLVTYRKPYNIERLLHRGKYNIDHVENIKEPWTLRNMLGKCIGITPDYTRGDKVIAWSIFFYVIIWGFGLSFVGLVVWNLISPWNETMWRNWNFFNIFIVGSIIGVITTVWFLWGGIKDIRSLFRDLRDRVNNPLDNGMVEGHVSLSDIEALGKDEDD